MQILGRTPTPPPARASALFVCARRLHQAQSGRAANDDEAAQFKFAPLLRPLASGASNISSRATAAAAAVAALYYVKFAHIDKQTQTRIRLGSVAAAANSSRRASGPGGALMTLSRRGRVVARPPCAGFK